jgi:succinate-acetate transporter protein
MEHADTLSPPRKLWVRALLMLLLAFAFQLAASILLFIAVLQLVLAAATDTPNARLQHFGRTLGHYLGQIASFETFASEELPFPFSAWPAENKQIDL